MLRITPDIEREWMTNRKDRINEAESIAAVDFLFTFDTLLRCTDIFLFVDSSASEGVLIRNYSQSPALAMAAAAFWEKATDLQTGVFICRCASALNLADSFSREDRTIGREWEWAEVQPILPPPERWRFLRATFAEYVAKSQARYQQRKTVKQQARQLGSR